MAKQVFEDEKYTSIRLPTSVKPIHYSLEFEPDLDKFTFTGTVDIEFVCHETTNVIVLHAVDLVISKGFVALDGFPNNSLTTVTYSKATETATLEFQNPISNGGILTLNYDGILNDKMRGFYRTAFKVGGNLIYAASTHFEATNARMCFPCWDEPALKATFSISLIIKKLITIGDKEYTNVGLSNMPEVSRSECPNGNLNIKFDKTPIMSTYLVALCVGPFEYIEGTDTKRQIRVYTTPGKAEHGKFALEVACKSLPFFEEYFGVEFYLSKLDMIAIPDFQGGAMENWGLVTYRETCLLVDPENSALTVIQNIAIIVAHELSHSWFGNLVTMQWWADLWLKEGFATFMSYVCVNHIFPEYNIWSKFVTDEYGRAMHLDSLNNSHSIEVIVENPADIEEIFDAISYKKGASVIRMLNDYIGDENFRKGLNAYLIEFSYKNAVTKDLWHSLEVASGRPISRLMSGWTCQKGYPWLSIENTMDGDSAILSVTQSKFTASGDLSEADANVSWIVPIKAVVSTDPAKAVDVCLIEGKTTKITIEAVRDSWLKLNPTTIGLYRTAYPSEMIRLLLPAISGQILSPLDRLGIQDDFFALCRAGKVGSVDLLELLQAFKAEKEYAVWKSIDCCMSSLSNLLSYTDYQNKFHAYGRSLYADIFRRLSWSPKEGESSDDTLARTLVLRRLVSFEDKDAIAESLRRFKAHVKKTETIPADLRSVVYRAAAAYGDEVDFKDLMNIHRTTEMHEEKNRAANALSFTRDPERLQKVVDFIYSDEVKSQDKVSALINLGASNPGFAWDLFQIKKEKLRELYEESYLLLRIIQNTTENFASEERAQEVSKFFEKNKFPGVDRTVQQSLETIRSNASWLERDADVIMKFLALY